MQEFGCCPREGCGLHLTAGKGTATQGEVVVPVRGTGCIRGPDADHRRLAVPNVVVPVRGAGCITTTQGEKFTLNVAVPVRGAGCILDFYAVLDVHNELLSP